MKKTLIASLLVMASASAFAVDWQNNTYLGVNVGQSDLRGFNGSNVAPGVDIDNKDTSVSVYTGYQFHPNFAAELGYTDLGNYDASFGGVGLGSVDANAWNLSLVGRHNFNEKFALTGRVGAGYTKAKFNGDSQSNTTPFYGVGAEYSFNQKVALTANWDRYQDFADTNHKLDNLSVGMKYKF